MPHSNGIRVIAWIVLAIINGDVARGQAGPNVIALLNGQAVLDCPVSSMASTQWTRTTDGNSNTLLIASSCSVSGNNAAYYSTEQLGGNICRLTIGNATMEMGGVYTCFDGSSTSYRSLVTAIDPVASVVYNQAEVVEGDQLDISCSINYSGPSSPAPSLHPSPYWTTSPGQSFTSAIYYPSSNVVTLVATVRVQKPTVPIFHCNTIFEITEGSTTGYNMTAPADNLTVGSTTIEMNVLSVSPNLWYLFLLLLLIPIFILGYLWYQKKLPCRTKAKSKDSDFLDHQEITDITHISKTTDLSTTPKEITDITHISKTTDPSTTPKENIEITHISKTTDPSTTPKENIELMHISKTTDPSTTPKENIELMHISKTTDPSTTPKEDP